MSLACVVARDEVAGVVEVAGSDCPASSTSKKDRSECSLRVV